MKRGMNDTQFYDEISKYTLTGKITVARMNAIIMGMFAKKTIDKVGGHQMDDLLDHIEAEVKAGKQIPIVKKFGKK